MQVYMTMIAPSGASWLTHQGEVGVAPEVGAVLTFESTEILGQRSKGIVAKCVLRDDGDLSVTVDLEEDP